MTGGEEETFQLKGTICLARGGAVPFLIMRAPRHAFAHPSSKLTASNENDSSNC